MKFYKFILKRILQTIPLLFIVSIISFFIIRLSPVDPLAELRLNPSISQETLLTLLFIFSGVKYLTSTASLLTSFKFKSEIFALTS